MKSLSLLSVYKKFIYLINILGIFSRYNLEKGGKKLFIHGIWISSPPLLLSRSHSNNYSLPVTKAKVFSRWIWGIFHARRCFSHSRGVFLVCIYTRNTRTTTFQSLNALLLLPKVNGKYSWCSFVYSKSLLFSSLPLWHDRFQATYCSNVLRIHIHTYRYAVAIRAIRVCKTNNQDETETKEKKNAEYGGKKQRSCKKKKKRWLAKIADNITSWWICANELVSHLWSGPWRFFFFLFFLFSTSSTFTIHALAAAAAAAAAAVYILYRHRVHRAYSSFYISVHSRDALDANIYSICVCYVNVHFKNCLPIDVNV